MAAFANNSNKAAQVKFLVSDYRFSTEMPVEDMKLAAAELQKLDRTLYDRIDAYMGAVLKMTIALGNRVGREQLDEVSFHIGSMLKAAAFLAIKDSSKRRLAKAYDSSQWALIARPPDRMAPNYDLFVTLENNFDLRYGGRHKYPFMNALFAPENLLNSIAEKKYLPRYADLGPGKLVPLEIGLREERVERMAKYILKSKEIRELCVPFQEEIMVMLHKSVCMNAARDALVSSAR